MISQIIDYLIDRKIIINYFIVKEVRKAVFKYGLVC